MSEGSEGGVRYVAHDSPTPVVVVPVDDSREQPLARRVIRVKMMPRERSFMSVLQKNVSCIG